MGTEITLDVGGIALTYSKNHRGMDHGSLFQEIDRKPLALDYDGETDDGSRLAEMGFSRPLKDVVPRLELLGFNLDHVRHEYEIFTGSWREEKKSQWDEDSPPLPELMSFSEFREFAIEHPLESLDNTFVLDGDRDQKKQIRGRFADMDVDRIPGYESFDNNAYSEQSYFGGLVNILHPYSVMRLLADGAANHKTCVVWHYGLLVENAYASEKEFTPGARRTETFLIATEGSSDVHILKHALDLLRPGIADFFRFIDVSESHPFSGTGNLVKFAEGLAKIDVQNQVLFLFDNDAEGLEALQRLSRLALPGNMRGTILPELEAFRAFPAHGPEGLRDADINGRAAAIECYLDLDLGCYAPPRIRWTNYKSRLGVYQGALEFKESYVKEFLEQTPATIAKGSYNVSKIEAILDLVAGECVAIAVTRPGLEAACGSW
jgi:hypothetical protein